MSYHPDELVRLLEEETGVTWSPSRVAACCALSPCIPVAPLQLTHTSLSEDRARALAFVDRWDDYWLGVARQRYRDGDYTGSRVAGLLLERAALRDKVLIAGQVACGMRAEASNAPAA